ncbi:MAG: isochorismatase family protein [Planctomycetia bacterium]
MRLHAPTSLLCVVDIQERLLAAMPDGSGVVAMATRLAEAARLLGVRGILTEQYPRGLGPTPADLAARLPPAISKMSFSCRGCEAFASAVPADVESVLLCGLETHVCILQTALDLLADGLTVFVAVDAVTSRRALDHEYGLRRLEASGALLTTSEAVLFEWCRSADDPRFQAVRRLVVAR